MGKYILIALIGLGLGLVTGCGSGNKKYEQRNQLEHNSKLWHSHALSDYEFNYIALCFCAEVREVVISVEDNHVSSAFHVDNGEYVAEDQLENLYTIDDLFTLADQLINERPYKLDISYNITYGYPETISVDYVRDIADDEITYRAWDLR